MLALGVGAIGILAYGALTLERAHSLHLVHSTQLGENTDALTKQHFLSLLESARNALLIYDDGNEMTNSIHGDREILESLRKKLSAFPGEKQFASWLSLAPRHAVTGGKPMAGKRTSRGMGATRVSNVLRMAATALIRSKSALGAALRRKARHAGMKTAIFATVRKLAQLVYRMLRWGQEYFDEGEAAYEEHYRQRTIAHLKTSAKDLGYRLVPDTPSAASPEPVSALAA